MTMHLLPPLKHALAGLTVALAASMGLAPVAGATSLSRVYVVEVPAAQDHAFNQGIKSWGQCLRTHGSRRTTDVYDAQTGDLSRYLFLNHYNTWAGMDAHEAAGKACRATFVSDVLPHVGNAYSEIAELNAKVTYMPGGGDSAPPAIMWVNGYRIRPGQGPAFHHALAKFAAAAAKTHWEGHFAGWDINAGGEGAENFVLVWPNKNWADVGQDPNPSAKDMMYHVYGKAAADANRRKFLATIADQWSDAWSYDKELSIVPEK
jgi:hypothetical protein